MDSDEGEETGKECIFPFQFNGNVHNECTWDQAAPGNPWCSTKVDENGVHIENIDAFKLLQSCLAALKTFRYFSPLLKGSEVDQALRRHIFVKDSKG